MDSRSAQADLAHLERATKAVGTAAKGTDDSVEELQRRFKAAESEAEKLKREVDRLGKSLDGLDRLATLARRGIQALFAGAIVHQIVSFTRETLAWGDAIAKAADRAGLGTTALQGYRYAAGLAGIEQQALDQALQQFNRNLGDAAGGVGRAQGVFRGLGISFTDAQGKIRDTNAVLLDVANALQNIESPAQRAAASSRLFGDAGAALAPLLKDGAAGLQEFVTQAEELGLIVDEDVLRKTEALSDELDVLGQVISTNFRSGFLEGFVGGMGSLSSVLGDPNFRQGLQDFGQFVGQTLAFLVQHGQQIIEVLTIMGAVLYGARLGGAVGGRAGAGIGAVAGGAAALALLNELNQSMEELESSAISVPQSLGAVGTEVVDLGTDSGEAANRIRQLVDQMDVETTQTDNLIAALGRSREEYDQLSTAYTLINRLRGQGINLESDEGAAIYQTATALEHKRQVLAELLKAEAEEARLARELARPFDRAAEGMADSFADAFETILKDGKLSFEKLADDIFKTFTRLIGDLLQERLFEPIIRQAFNAVGSTLGFEGQLSISPAAQHALDSLDKWGAENLGFAGTGGTPGSPTFSGALGGAAMGFGIGSIGGSLLAPNQGGQMGASIGGGIGGFAGSFLPFPGGQLLGSLVGSLLGGGIGSVLGDKATPYSRANIGLTGGELGQTTETRDMSSAIAEALGKSAMEALEGVVDELGGSFTGSGELGKIGRRGKGFFSRVGDDVHKFKDEGAAIADFTLRALQAAAQSGNIEGLSETLVTILNKEFEDLGELSEAIAFGKIYDALLAPAEDLSAMEKTLKELAETFDGAREKAAELGLEIGRLDAAEADAITALREGFEKSIADQILAIEDPDAARRKSLEDDIAVMIRDALALGADASLVERLANLRRQQLEDELNAVDDISDAVKDISRELQSIRDFLDNQLLDDLSSLSPQDKLVEAQSQFGDVLRKARGGDAEALGSLPGAARSVLEAGRDIYASGTEFALLEKLVRSSLESVLSQNEQPRSTSMFGGAQGATGDLPMYMSRGGIIDSINAQVTGTPQAANVNDTPAGGRDNMAGFAFVAEAVERSRADVVAGIEKLGKELSHDRRGRKFGAK